MPTVTISTVEEFQVTRFGPRIVELTTLLNLPLPTIMVLPLTKFERKDLWGFKVNQPGRQTDPTTEAIIFKLMHDDKERGLEVVMQDLIGRLLEVLTSTSSVDVMRMERPSTSRALRGR